LSICSICFQSPSDRTCRLVAEPGRIERLRDALQHWLAEPFEGRYDEAYFGSGVTSPTVRVELPQHYMFIAMNIIRWRSRESGGCGFRSRHAIALHKLIRNWRS
jgi:hypothetical protein